MTRSAMVSDGQRALAVEFGDALPWGHSGVRVVIGIARRGSAAQH